VKRTGALEEPISPELVLVDRDLAVQAREASADPPWLLPAVAEARQGAGVTPAVSIKEPRPRPSFSRHLRATAVVGCAVVALVAAVSLALELVPGSAKPTLAKRRAEAAAPAPKKPTKNAKAQGTPKPKAARTAKSKPQATRSPKRSAPRRAAKPKAPPAVTFKRAFSWRRYRGAAYYQVHLQRGVKTVYEVRTLKRTASIRLKLRPGRYHAIVRPAFSTDAGITLGPAILDKIVRAA
jgi:hypothetical protein